MNSITISPWKAVTIPALVVGAALTIAPVGVSAQDFSDPPVSDVAREILAEETYQQATTVSLQPGQWERAAELYMQSAELMSPDDPRAFESSVSAAQIFYSLGKNGDVIKTLVAAGERAHRFGQVLNAAQAYMLAAGVCAEVGRGAEALAYAERGRQLAASPHISNAERAGILRWAEGETTIRTVQR